MAILSLVLSNLIIATLLAVPALLASLWGRRPALTHALWLLVLIKLVTPPLFEYPIELPRVQEPVVVQAIKVVPVEPMPPVVPVVEPEERDAESPPPMANEVALDEPLPEAPIAPVVLPVVAAVAPVVEPQEAPNDRQVSALDVVQLAWLVGSFAWLMLAGVRLWRFQRLLRFVQPAPLQVQALACELADALKVTCPEIGLLPGQVSPMLWGLGRRPRLLLPAALLERLTPDQLATLLAHELAHWRRRDDRVRWLELVVLAVYWWCPLAWWARRELQRAEEECCDAWVVAVLPESAKAYALALVETVDFLSGAPAPVPLAASGLGRVRFLKRRLTMILQGKTPRALTFTGLLFVAGVGVLLLPLVFSRTANVQVGAQPDPAKKGAGKVIESRIRFEFDPDRDPQIEHLRADILRMQKDMEKFQAELMKRQHEMRERADQLHKAMQILNKLENDRPRPGPAGGGAGGGGPGGFPGGPGGAGGPGGPGGLPPMGGGNPGWPGPGGPPGNVDQRLKQVEAKLDAILAELRELRGARAPKAMLPMPNPMPKPPPMPNPIRPKAVNDPAPAVPPNPPTPPRFNNVPPPPAPPASPPGAQDPDEPKP